jgi:hypothetical protein
LDKWEATPPDAAPDVWFAFAAIHRDNWYAADLGDEPADAE